VYRDPAYLAEVQQRAANPAANLTMTRSCGSASEAANFAELGIL
jgi:hypothetical protein